MNKNRHLKYQIRNKKALWIIAIIFAPLIAALVLISLPDRRIHFYSTLIIGNILVVIMVLLGLMFLKFATEKNTGFGKRIIFIFFAVDFIIITLLTGKSNVDQYKDVPNVITSNYEIKVGNLTSCNINYSRRHRGTKFEIDGYEFYVDRTYDNLFVLGDRYKIKYLPYSDYVMNIIKLN